MEIHICTASGKRQKLVDLFLPFVPRFVFKFSFPSLAVPTMQRCKMQRARIYKAAFNYKADDDSNENKSSVLVDKATECEGEERHLKNLYDHCREMVDAMALTTPNVNKRRAKIYRYRFSCARRLHNSLHIRRLHCSTIIFGLGFYSNLMLFYYWCVLCGLCKAEWYRLESIVSPALGIAQSEFKVPRVTRPFQQ